VTDYPQAHPDGCRIMGMLFVKRVPGAMTISVHSEHHSFDHSMINMAHTVNVLVFGDPLDETAKVGPGEISRAHPVESRCRVVTATACWPGHSVPRMHVLGHAVPSPSIACTQHPA
jgi:hypothetical protein